MPPPDSSLSPLDLVDCTHLDVNVQDSRHNGFSLNRSLVRLHVYNKCLFIAQTRNYTARIVFRAILRLCVCRGRGGPSSSMACNLLWSVA